MPEQVKRSQTVEIVDVRASMVPLLADGFASLVIWYNFAILGLLAVFVGRALVPTANLQLATLVILAIFAAGFFTRPIGTALMKRFDARFGRKASHGLVITGMALATALIGLLPEHPSSGALGLTGLIVLRLVQGILAGAELPGPVAQMVGSAPHGLRGLYSCWPMTINLSGYGVSAAVALLLVSLAGVDATFAGAWRYAFLAALPLAVLAAILRFTVSTTVVRKTIPAPDVRAPKAPTADITRARDVILTLGSVLVYNATTGAFQVGVPWVLVASAGWSLVDALAMALLFSIAPLTFAIFGSVADRIGHLRTMGAGAFGVFLLAYPCFALLGQGGSSTVFAFIIGFVLMGMLGGSIQGFLAERLPNRSPKVQLIYALSAAIFGGTSPFIINAIAYYCGNLSTAASYYLVASGAVSLVALIGIAAAGLPGSRTESRAA